MGKDMNQSNQNTEKQIAKLALLGEGITLFGQAISTLSAYLALEELDESKDPNYNHLQAQIDYLLSEMNILKS
ncbi:hypothetical protein [Sporosarcina obsidiansis]|uniref:hypothetical protein n=1 Tax=Sporosarcina obsidiansis TaxID=2660748 RepID=UPI00129A3F0F|nr:hypothetical protein [Sporosarcina obsidiansis]